MGSPVERLTAVLAALLLLSTTACQSQDRYFLVVNELDVTVVPFRWDSSDVVVPEPIDFEHGVSPGNAQQIGLLTSDDPWYYRTWPLRNWAPQVCRDDLYVYAYAEDGRLWSAEPPLCSEEEWVITD